MKRIRIRRLVLNRQTIRSLGVREIADAKGGVNTSDFTSNATDCCPNGPGGSNTCPEKTDVCTMPMGVCV